MSPWIFILMSHACPDDRLEGAAVNHQRENRKGKKGQREREKKIRLGFAFSQIFYPPPRKQKKNSEEM